jgi:hypothetical protein
MEIKSGQKWIGVTNTQLTVKAISDDLVYYNYDQYKDEIFQVEIARFLRTFKPVEKRRNETNVGM